MTQLTLAKPEHRDVLIKLVEDFHREEGVQSTETSRSEGLMPLLEGSPHGVVYLAGPTRAPIGYVVIRFGWSLEFGGMDGFVDEIYIRPGVRGRGIGTELLTALPKRLAAAGLKAMHLEVDRENMKARALYAKLGYRPRERYMLMTRSFGD